METQTYINSVEALTAAIIRGIGGLDHLACNTFDALWKAYGTLIQEYIAKKSDAEILIIVEGSNTDEMGQLLAAYSPSSARNGARATSEFHAALMIAHVLFKRATTTSRKRTLPMGTDIPGAPVAMKMNPTTRESPPREPPVVVNSATPRTREPTAAAQKKAPAQAPQRILTGFFGEDPADITRMHGDTPESRAAVKRQALRLVILFMGVLIVILTLIALSLSGII